MNLREVDSVKKRLEKYVTGFTSILGRSERVYWCNTYLSGLMLNGERKSIEPMAKRLPNGNEQALQQFVNQSPWDHEQVQSKLNQMMINKFKFQRGVLVLDDTSLPKKGEHSVGVGRQYCGALGKVANCQSIVSWLYATESFHFPVRGRVYLPSSWTDDPQRMNRVGVPKQHQQFKTKWQIALELLEEIKDVFDYECIVFDAGYGEIKEFLRSLSRRAEIFMGQIPESHSFWPQNIALNTKIKKKGRPRKKPSVADKTAIAPTAKKWRDMLLKSQKWKRVTINQKTRKLVVEAIAVRVKEVITQAYRTPGEELWLVIEKLPCGQFKYYVSNAPENTPLRQLILWAHERWKVEQGYQHLKQELGLDHFEGRSWRGLHHHFTLCVMAYCFLLMIKKGYPKKVYVYSADD